MSKTTICKELNQQKKALGKEKDSLIQKKQSLYRAYSDMKGRYGKRVFDPYADPHFSPYYFTYPSEEVKQKEEAEREKYLVQNGYYDIDQQVENIEKQIDELDERLCQVKYGMSREERKKRHNLEAVEKSIELCAKKMEFLKREKERAEQKLQEYLANKK